MNQDPATGHAVRLEAEAPACTWLSWPRAWLGFAWVCFIVLFLASMLPQMQAFFLIFGFMALLPFGYFLLWSREKRITPWQDRWVRISACLFLGSCAFSVLYPELFDGSPFGEPFIGLSPFWHTLRGLIALSLGWTVLRDKKDLYWFLSIAFVLLLLRTLWPIGNLLIFGWPADHSLESLGNSNVLGNRLFLLCMLSLILCSRAFSGISTHPFWCRLGYCLIAYMPTQLLHPHIVAPKQAIPLYLPFAVIVTLAMILRHLGLSKALCATLLMLAYASPFAGYALLDNADASTPWFLLIAISLATAAAAAWYLLQHQPKMRRILIPAVVLIAFGVLVLSRSNQAIILWIIGLVLFGIFFSLRMQGRMRRIVLTAIACVAIAVCAVIAWKPNALLSGPRHSLVQRLVVWNEAWRMIEEDGGPLGAGYGYRQFRESWDQRVHVVPAWAARIDPLWKGEAGSALTPHPHAHNIFIQIYFERGVFGILSSCLLWICILAYAWRQFRRAASQSLLAASVALTLILLFPLQHFVDYLMWGGIESFFWICLGIALATPRLCTQQEL